jgi:hypothetical protein
MAATVVAPQTPTAAYVSESATQMAALTWSAVDITNTNKVTMTGRKLLLLFRNDDAAPQTVTVSSSADAYGRTADITAFSITNGEYAMRILEPPGWEQTLGGRDIIIDASDADMKFAALNL